MRRRHVVCVILGDGFRARMLSLGLRALRGASCIICDTRSARCGYFVPTAEFCGLCHTDEQDILAKQLENITDEDSDSLYFLIALKDKYRWVTDVFSDRLESRYIFTDRHRVFDDVAPCDI